MTTTPAAAAPASTAPARLAGVDVASFQGPPGQWRGPAGPIRWAAVKLTEAQPGGIAYVNPDAAADLAYLKEQGLGRVAYLFAHPSVPVAETAALFLAQAARLGLDDGDGVAIDLEVADGLPAPQVAAWAGELAALLGRQLARDPLLYTYLSFAWAGNCAGLGHLPLWISDPSSPEGRPRVPAPWTAWAIHQWFTGAPVDKDTARYPDLAAMAAALGKQAAPSWQQQAMAKLTAGQALISEGLAMVRAHAG